MNINELQAQASDPNYSVYISASAGSGKTKVLIDRMLRLLLNGTEIGNILCVTFTNAAADEMVARLQEKAKHWLLCEEVDLRNELRTLTCQEPDDNTLKTARDLYNAIIKDFFKIKIQTIHAFCANILNIDSSNSEKKIISTAQKNDFMQRAFSAALQTESIADAIKVLSTLYGHKTLLHYAEQLLSKYTTFSRYIKDWHDVKPEHSWQSYIHEQLLLLDIHTLSRIALIIGHEEMWQWLMSDSETKLEQLDSYAQIFLTKDLKKRMRITGYKLLNEKDLDILLRHQDHLFNLIQHKKEIYSAMHQWAFTKFCAAMLLEYNRLKAQDNLLTYDELLTGAIDALSISDQRHWLLWRLDCAIDHILVDEAQDLNNYQWRIINLLTDEFFAGDGAKDIRRTIFIVGDIKQSIFSFQGAEPDIFRYIPLYYKEKVEAAHQNWLELNLNTSFRSGIEILENVDRIFSSNADFAKHISARQTRGHFEIWPAIVDDNDNTEDATGWALPQNITRNSKHDKLADFIVSKIHGWLLKQRVIAGSNKVIEPGDVMIIFRKRGVIHNAVINHLIKHNIPAAAYGGKYLLDELPIMDILSVARFVINPLDNFNLVNLLKSPFFNFSEQEILDIAYNIKQTSLYDKIQGNAKDKLLLFQQLAQTYDLYEFFYRIAFKVLSGPSIDKLLESILIFKEECADGHIAEFLRWLQLSEIQVETNQMLGAVRVTTAHSAKGLQAKIVILADASESENLAYDNIFWKNDELIFSSGMQYETDLIKNAKEDAKELYSNENQRLLYVALTRAEDELYIAGLENNKHGTWYKLSNIA